MPVVAGKRRCSIRPIIIRCTFVTLMGNRANILFGPYPRGFSL
jgi:hypothetical protein